jgi:hypothetical protein
MWSKLAEALRRTALIAENLECGVEVSGLLAWVKIAPLALKWTGYYPPPPQAEVLPPLRPDNGLDWCRRLLGAEQKTPPRLVLRADRGQSSVRHQVRLDARLPVVDGRFEATKIANFPARINGKVLLSPLAQLLSHCPN